MSRMTDGSGEHVIARLRAALDEIAAAPATSTPTMHRRSARSRAPGPWLAAAAATLVLVVGAVWALGTRDPGTERAPASAPETSTPPSSTAAAASGASWFSIASTDLVAEPVSDVLPGSGFGAAWISNERGDAPRLLLLRVVGAEFRAAPSTTVAGLHDVMERPQPDGSTWKFSAIGFDPATAQRLASQVVAGSGMPFVLPDPAVRLLAFATPSDQPGHSQRYVGGTTTVILQVHPYSGQFELFNDGTSTRYVAVAGVQGYATRRADGSTLVVWPAANGRWATMHIQGADAIRVDELIATVGPAEAPS